jgi:ATP-dependent Clp protease ATP-binding subunit ClpA
LDLISEVGFDETYGARPLKRAIQDKVEDFISEEVLKGVILEDVSYILYVDNTDVKLKTIKKTKKKKGEN